MKVNITVLLTLSLFFLSYALIALPAQVPTTNAVQRFSRAPSMLYPYVTALGDRLSLTAKEQTIFTGEAVTRTGTRAAQVIYQLPDLVRLQGLKPGATPLSFDGERTVGVTSLDDELLLETFVMDFLEGMLAAVRAGAALRVVGVGFGPDPRTMRAGGPRMDIVEVTGPVRTQTQPLIRSRLYYFDSYTGLLVRTRSEDFSRSSPVRFETRFSDWQLINDAAYPRRIERYENSQLVFSFTAASITAAPPLARSAFQ